MSRPCSCPECGEDISESYQGWDPDCGINAGWYCDACNCAVPDDGEDDSYEWELER